MSDDVTRCHFEVDPIAQCECYMGAADDGLYVYAEDFDTLAARLRDAEAENARLKGIIGQARKALSRFERADVGDCDPLDLAKVADHALNLLGTPSTSEARDA